MTPTWAKLNPPLHGPDAPCLLTIQPKCQKSCYQIFTLLNITNNKSGLHCTKRKLTKKKKKEQINNWFGPLAGLGMGLDRVPYNLTGPVWSIVKPRPMKLSKLDFFLG